MDRCPNLAFAKKFVAILCLLPVVGLAPSAVRADVESARTQVLQELDCDWWDFVTKFIYEDHALLVEAGIGDPIDALKDQVDYAAYHTYSAGRAILDQVFSGLDAQNPMGVSRADVAAMCLDFPAIAVTPENVYAPMIGEAL